MKAPTHSALIAGICFLFTSLAQTHLLAQDSFPPLVDPNVNNSQIPGGNAFPGNNSFQGGGSFQGGSFPGNNGGILPESGEFAPLVDPNVVDPAPQADGQNLPAPQGEMLDQPVPQAMVPNSFPEAINEPMNDWLDWSEWESSVELGINGSSGNSESFNVSSGFDIKRETDANETRIGLKYINNKSNDVLVAHTARLTLDWEKKFGEELGGRFEPSRWSWFIKNTYYYDDFRPFDLRVALNSGLGYKLFEDEIQMVKGRFGAGVSREFGGVDDDWVPEALFGLDYRRQLSKRQKIDFTADYFPSWADFEDYRVVTDFNWEFLLDEETNMSLKLNINNRYDSTPDGAKAHDIFYSLLMLWKF